MKAFIIAQSAVLYVVDGKKLDAIERYFTIDQVIWILYQQIKWFDLRGNYQIYMTDTVRFIKLWELNFLIVNLYFKSKQFIMYLLNILYLQFINQDKR